jgi:hypothetical protein
MSWNGAGGFNRIYSWIADKAAGLNISSTRMDADSNDIAGTGFGNCLTRDGQGQPSANLPMANFRHTGVGSGIARTDYAALGQVEDGIVNWATATGTGDSIAATYTPALTALTDGQLCFLRASAANATTAPTFAPNGLAARAITRAGGTALSAGDIPGALAEVILRYNLVNARWELLNPATSVPGAATITMSMLQLGAVTYPKLQAETTGTLIGNFSGTASAPGEAILGSGLSQSLTGALAISGAANNGAGLIRLAISSTATLTAGRTYTVSGVTGTTEANGNWPITIVDSTHVDLQGSTFANAYAAGGQIGRIAIASAPPVAATFKNLSIKVATTTTVTVAADFVAMADGAGNFLVGAVSATCNLGSSGNVNQLDTGAIAVDTWYYIWTISNGATIGTLASTSSTAPAMPAGFTYKARIGAVQTIHASATLYGTLQLGRVAQYVVGLAQTSQLPVMGSGAAGTFSATSPSLVNTSTGRFAPSTASRINILLNNLYKTGGGASNMLAAPSVSYGGANNGPSGSNGMSWPFFLPSNANTTVNGWMLLESSNIVWASDSSPAAVVCLGWEDNI